MTVFHVSVFFKFYIHLQEFETFVRDSGLAPFSPLTHEGFWRQLNVRTTRNKDILIIPMVSAFYLCSIIVNFTLFKELN